MDEKMDTCKSCGAFLEQGDRFCGQCGRPVSKAPAAGAEDAARRGTPAARTEAGKDAQEGKKKTSLGTILSICVLVVVLMAFGTWAAYKWVVSRPVNIDTSELLPQNSTPAQVRPERQLPEPDRAGKIVRGWLGLGAQDVSLEITDRIGMTTPSGALVNGCEPGGPADRAGILPGDVVLEMDGVQVASAADLRQKAGQQTPGKMLQLKIWREGSSYTLSLLVGERPSNTERQKRAEMRQHTAAYDACFARYCPGCNSPSDLLKEQTPECRQCETFHKSQLEECAQR